MCSVLGRIRASVPGSAPTRARQLTPQAQRDEEIPATCTVRCMLHNRVRICRARGGRPSMARRMSRLRLLALVAAMPVRRSGCSCPCSRTARRSRSRIEEKRSRSSARRAASASSRPRSRATRTGSTTLQGDITVAAGPPGADPGRPRRASAPSSTGSRTTLRQERIRLVKLRARLAESRAALAERLVELYKADKPDVVTVILESDGFADLLERAEFIQRVCEQDARIIDRVRTAKARGRRGRAPARPARAAPARGHRRWSRAAHRRSSTIKDAARRPARASTPACATTKHAGARLDTRDDRHELEGDLARSRRSRPRSQARARAAPARRGPRGPDPPGLGPAHLAGQRHVHLAVRVSAGAGCTPASTSPPRRARRSAPPTPARVVIAGWTGGYGNYTCISHGGSLSTCYGHQSRYRRRRSARTSSQGQVIGYVGNTGHSFGAHLHFEVRVNGHPVDPMGYLLPPRTDATGSPAVRTLPEACSPRSSSAPLTLQSFGLMMGLGFVVAGLSRVQAPEGARAAGGLGVRDGLRRAGRRHRRRAPVVGDPELGRGEGRPARLALLRLRPRLLRRPARRRDRRARPGRGGAACSTAGRSTSRRRAARRRLRDRPDRLPARRRRRLRQGVGRPVGDGLSRRHRADDRGGPPDAGLRDARDGLRRLVPVAPPRQHARRAACSRSTSCSRAPSASSSSSCAATTRRGGPHAAAARRAGDDGDRRRLAAGACVARRRAGARAR